MTYEVSGIYPKQYDNEVAGGDSEYIENFNNKQKAFRVAMSESKKKKWWEVQVRCSDGDGELTGHWYFKNGKLTERVFKKWGRRGT